MKAVFNGTVIAESDDTKIVEGNHYFPKESVNKEYFSATDRTTVCGWKGTANYYSIEAGGQTAENAAWYYADPKDQAEEIRDHVAFYNVVSVED